MVETLSIEKIGNRRWLLLSLLVILLDQISKYWLSTKLDLGQTIPVFSFFDLTLSYNAGAAFGFLRNAAGWQAVFFSTLALAVSAYILMALKRMPANHNWLAAALSLILGGALGNLADRVRLHYVIDFFHFHLHDWHFAIFNVADSAISIGAAMLILYMIRTAR